MEEGYVDINNVSTRIVTIGGWIDQPLQSDKLIIVIPGTSFSLLPNRAFLYRDLYIHFFRKSWTDWLL